jgi:hypothetical protein
VLLACALSLLVTRFEQSVRKLTGNAFGRPSELRKALVYREI